MAATKKKKPYAIITETQDEKWHLPAFIVSNGGMEHLVHRSPKNPRILTCNCEVGKKHYCCDAMSAYFAIVNKAANTKSAADEVKATQARAETVTIRSDTGPRLYR